MIIKQDKKLIEAFFKLVYVPGFCCEVRIFDAEVDNVSKKIKKSSYHTTVAGWFDRPDELSCELARIEDASAYITVNPVKLARRPFHGRNNLKVLRKGDFCVDQDIEKIRFIIIDIDPVRPPGNDRSNSSHPELQECIDVRDSILAHNNLWKSSLYGISGNGAFILIKVDYPNDDNSNEDVFALTNQLSLQYSNQYCKVDINVRTPSKLLGIPGTIKYKGVISTPIRPYRMVEITGGEPNVS